MLIDFDQFLGEFAAFIAEAADVEYASTPRALWTYTMVEMDSTLNSEEPSPATVLRIYDGSLDYVPAPILKMQSSTTGVESDDAGSLQAAQVIYNALLDSAGHPLRMQSLVHYRINAILNLRIPAIIKRDEKSRALTVFNFDAEVIPL